MWHVLLDFFKSVCGDLVPHVDSPGPARSIIKVLVVGASFRYRAQWVALTFDFGSSDMSCSMPYA
jgi:hypothetical protein